MKTETRARILKIIGQRGGVRPIELIQELGFSAQAVHRHLRVLLEAGTLERNGRGPKTLYRVAGAPCLDEARRWCSAETEPAIREEFVCETRDAFTGRLSRLSPPGGPGLAEAELPLAIAVAGEIGNNCFDHNLGQWRDVPGCWFEVQATGGRFWICIADRGQGVFRSLRRVAPAIPDEQAALAVAFEKTLSGRAPENRGNGLKFVRNVIVAGGNRGLACRSGSGLVDYGRLGPECRRELERFPPQPGGTVTLVLWGLK